MVFLLKCECIIKKFAEAPNLLGSKVIESFLMIALFGCFKMGESPNYLVLLGLFRLV